MISPKEKCQPKFYFFLPLSFTVALLFSITIMSLLLVSVTGSCCVAVPFVAVLFIVTLFDVGVTLDVDAGFWGVRDLGCVGVTGLVMYCDVTYCCCCCCCCCCDGAIGFVTICDDVVCVTGFVVICVATGFCCVGGVTGFDLLGKVWGNLAGAGITADVTGGITVVTGVDGADIVEEDLPKMKLLLFKILNYFSDDIFMKFDVKGRRVIRKKTNRLWVCFSSVLKSSQYQLNIKHLNV